MLQISFASREGLERWVPLAARHLLQRHWAAQRKRLRLMHSIAQDVTFRPSTASQELSVENTAMRRLSQELLARADPSG